MKERLTKREKNGLAYFPMCFTQPCNGEGCKDENCIFINDVCERLAEYEDLEEQGRLLRLPCKMGDTVYVKMTASCKTRYVEAEVRDFTYFKSFGFCVVITSKHFDKQNIPFSEFGKTVFLSEEEAEAKLKEMEEKS